MEDPTTITRPYALSIAGFDPSGGAGLVADAKAMEAQGVYGLTVATAITVQTEDVFERVQWVDEALIIQQLQLLLEHYSVSYCKIGLIENWRVLQVVTNALREAQPSMVIIVDPILKASAGFDFEQATSWDALTAWLPNIDLLTPNAQELAQINPSESNVLAIAERLARYTSVLYKGGHNTVQKGVDVLLHQGKHYYLPPPTLSLYEKHGSGCVLSASIVAQLAKGLSLLEACQVAKQYTTDFLDSSAGLLGYHYHQTSKA